MSVLGRMIDSHRAWIAITRLTPRFVLVLSFGFYCALAIPAHPQSALDALRQRDQELESIRLEQKKNFETQAKLKAEISEIGTDRQKLNQALIASADRLRAFESQIAETEERLRPLDASEQIGRAHV